MRHQGHKPREVRIHCACSLRKGALPLGTGGRQCLYLQGHWFNGPDPGEQGVRVARNEGEAGRWAMGHQPLHGRGRLHWNEVRRLLPAGVRTLHPEGKPKELALIQRSLEHFLHPLTLAQQFLGEARHRRVLRAWLEGGRRGSTPWHLARKAVVLLEPRLGRP